MRIIAGEFRSRTLQSPSGLATRPTSDRLRETLFNVLAPRIQGAAFLDLYAGSGAVGIEALSRGAARADFVERAPAALAALRANLVRLRLTAGFRIHSSSVAAWLRRFDPGAAPVRKLERDPQPKLEPEPQRPSAPSFDVVFIDPPYTSAQDYASTLGMLGTRAARILSPGAWVIAEHGRQGSRKNHLEDRYGSLERMRVLEQGDAALSFYSVRSAHSAQ
jgi:16S rRNA (guanine(966)-N(2))-methyltransferase RsmD